MIYGYIRLSILCDSIQEQLKELSLNKESCFIDVSRRLTNELPQRQVLLETVKKGDIVHVASLDRFVTSARDLQKVIPSFLRKKVGLHFHKENFIISPCADPASTQAFLNVLGTLHSWECSILRELEEESFSIQKKTQDFFEDEFIMTEKVKEKVRRYLLL